MLNLMLTLATTYAKVTLFLALLARGSALRSFTNWATERGR